MTILPSSQRGETAAKVSTVAAWRPTLAMIGVAIVAFGLGFHREATDAVGVWIASTAYNHCFLVLPVVFYLLWERRVVISALSPRPTPWPLLLMPLLSAVWFIAAALDVNEGRQLLVVAMFEVVLWSALGTRLYRLLLAPLLFLFFLVPSGAFLVPWLQSVTAKMTVAGLQLLHIPVFSDGYLIDIPEGRFEIAEACAGLRFLIAASVFSCLFAVVMYRGWLRRAFYIALSIAAAIAANGVRAFGILLLAHLLGSASAAETDHILYGWLFFSLVIALLIGIGMLFREKDQPPAPLPASLDELPARRWRVAAIPIAALLALSGPAYAAWENSLTPHYPLPSIAGPAVSGSWHPLTSRVTDWRPVVHGADREIFESFDSPDGAVVTRYMAFYRLRATGNRLTLSENRVADDVNWRVDRRSAGRLDLAGESGAITQTYIAQGPREAIVWSFFVVDGRIAASLLKAKLLQLRAVLHQRRPVGALVMVETSADEGVDRAEAELHRFLAASQPFPKYIAALRHEAEREEGGGAQP